MATRKPQPRARRGSSSATSAAPRQAGPLRVSDEMRMLLGHCFVQGEPIPENPTLSLERVLAIEQQLGAALPDDALALAASRSHLLRHATGFSLDEVLDFADDERDLPDDHVAIAVVYSEPFAELYEGAHGGPFFTLAIRRGRKVSDPEVLLVTENGTPKPPTLAAFARARIEEWHRSRNEASPLASAGAIDFVPVLVATPARAAPVERVVDHPRLGRGRLLEERDDKWVVAFDDGSTRTLLRSAFPQALPDAPAVPIAPRAPPREPVPDHPLWPVFADKLRARGVDPERGFFEQADASKGTNGDGFNYRCRDADARARVTLNLLRELCGRRPRRLASYESSESEIWSSPADCFRSAV